MPAHWVGRKIMTRISISLLAAGAALAAFSAPAFAATTVVNGSCVSVTDVHGCLFSGNINENSTGNNSYGDAQDAYNLYNDTHPSAAPDITLTYLAKSDLSGFPGTVSGGSSSGTWSLPGYLVSFVAVKAGSHFVLYELSSPVSSGNWSTVDLGNKDISHLEFFGTVAPPVPEPASWAMLVAGLGVVGFAMRRRKTAVSFA
jgi:hypothetical protein